MGVIVNMLCAVRWPAVINMELMLWTQIVVYFDNTFTFTRLRVCLTRMPPRHRPQLWHRSRRHRHRPRLRPLLRRRIFHNTVSISGLDPDSPHPQPWQSKIVTRNKVHRLYSQQLFYSARAGGLGCMSGARPDIDTVKLSKYDINSNQHQVSPLLVLRTVELIKYALSSRTRIYVISTHYTVVKVRIQRRIGWD